MRRMSTTIAFMGLIASPLAAQAEDPGLAGASPSPPGCDATCLRANADRASLDCAPRIEAVAPGDFDWMNRPLPGIFQQADPSGPGNAVVRYRGDSVRFMDPKGTWRRITYECVYDAMKHEVVGINVRPGRLDRPEVVEAPPKPAPVTPKPVRLKYGEPSPVEVKQAPSTVRF